MFRYWFINSNNCTNECRVSIMGKLCSGKEEIWLTFVLSAQFFYKPVVFATQSPLVFHLTCRSRSWPWGCGTSSPEFTDPIHFCVSSFCSSTSWLIPNCPRPFFIGQSQHVCPGKQDERAGGSHELNFTQESQVHRDRTQSFRLHRTAGLGNKQALFCITYWEVSSISLCSEKHRHFLGNQGPPLGAAMGVYSARPRLCTRWAFETGLADTHVLTNYFLTLFP